MVEQKRIARVDLNGRDHTLTAVTTAGKKHESGYPQDYGTELVKTLRAHDVAFTVEGTKRSALVSAAHLRPAVRDLHRDSGYS